MKKARCKYTCPCSTHSSITVNPIFSLTLGAHAESTSASGKTPQFPTDETAKTIPLWDMGTRFLPSMRQRTYPAMSPKRRLKPTKRGRAHHSEIVWMDVARSSLMKRKLLQRRTDDAQVNRRDVQGDKIWRANAPLFECISNATLS